MSRNESDEMPMLEPSVELSDFSVSSGGQPDYGYFSGPLRPPNRNYSGSLRNNRYFSGPINIDSRGAAPALSSILSISNAVRRRSQVQSHTETHEELLRSGPLGKCNDPYCTTCPLYSEEKYHRPEALSILSPDQKVNLNFLQKTKYFFTNAHAWGKACIPGVMNPHTRRVQQWNKVFISGCLLAIFVDPLFFFIFGVDKVYNCILFNITFAKIITILRSFTDLVYFLHMLLQFRLAFNNPYDTGTTALNDNPKQIVHHYLSSWFILDIFVVFPLPQVMTWMVFPTIKTAGFAENLIRITVLLQYIPRMMRFVPLLAGKAPTGFIFETAWSNFFVNLLLFLLVAHVVGSCWYLFGLQRVNQCFRDACVNATSDYCDKRFLDCGHDGNVPERMEKINESLWNIWKNNSNATQCRWLSTTVFTYGIYTSAVNVTITSSYVEKYVYSLFWGFQQISTLAGNQMPSLFIWEILFVFGIVALGLLLTVLLIGNMQNFLLSLSSRRVEMQLRRHDVEAWMTRRQLQRQFGGKVQAAEQFRWAVNRGLNEEELLKSLPENLEKEVRKVLCLNLIKRVKLFTFMEDPVLDAICERLRQSLYIKGSTILRMKHPINKMHFFMNGKLESLGEDQSMVILQDGDFCGDELLDWCLERDSEQPSGKRAGQRPHALSSRTVKCISNVEAFSLTAPDLEEVAKLYSRSLRNVKVRGAIRYWSPHWRTRAATCIQVCLPLSEDRCCLIYASCIEILEEAIEEIILDPHGPKLDLS